MHPWYFSPKVAEGVLDQLDFFRGYHEAFSQVNHYDDALRSEDPYSFSDLVKAHEGSVIPSGLSGCDYTEETSTVFTKKSLGPPQPPGTYENEDTPLPAALCARLRSK